jgi:hypothetical protein
VGRAADLDAVQVDGGGVDRPREVNLLADERAYVRGRDPGRLRIVVAAAGVPAEARPVVTGGRDRLLRAGGADGDDPREKDQD